MVCVGQWGSIRIPVRGNDRITKSFGLCIGRPPLDKAIKNNEAIDANKAWQCILIIKFI